MARARRADEGRDCVSRGDISGHGRCCNGCSRPRLWYADDGALADAVEGIIQTAVDIMILLSEEILGLKVGHDAAEASKSASVPFVAA